ncbi:tellurite resistance TerB family protein [Rhodocytophaga rosea]|uniref:Tellurite resistance TerB family protein n=1 Tax=Rhodocytophaga rosea TaxID=2704465 RepID=A0A6C0GTQ3_9BACT|nr:tellurite resistance TerB family protein [Rhodocytophaga rosea]QHT70812.1 tellurite resistance TerB family protein [Rhodocytophaga rosea]
MEQDPPISCPHQAFFAVIFACMAADGYVNAQEVETFVKILSKRKQFEGQSGVELFKFLFKVHQQVGGSKALIQQAAPLVDPSERKALFAAAIEAMQADTIYHVEELALIETLQGSLGISAEEVMLDLTVLERIAST